MEYLMSDDSFLGVVGFQDQILVAYGNIFFERKIRSGLIAHIDEVVVHGGYRNSGIGTLLITEMLNQCKAKECFKVMLYCHDEVQDFYLKNGFIKEGIVMKSLLKT